MENVNSSASLEYIQEAKVSLKDAERAVANLKKIGHDVINDAFESLQTSPSSGRTDKRIKKLKNIEKQLATPTIETSRQAAKYVKLIEKTLENSNLSIDYKDVATEKMKIQEKLINYNTDIIKQSMSKIASSIFAKSSKLAARIENKALIMLHKNDPPFSKVRSELQRLDSLPSSALKRRGPRFNAPPEKNFRFAEKLEERATLGRYPLEKKEMSKEVEKPQKKIPDPSTTKLSSKPETIIKMAAKFTPNAHDDLAHENQYTEQIANMEDDGSKLHIRTVNHIKAFESNRENDLEKYLPYNEARDYEALAKELSVYQLTELLREEMPEENHHEFVKKWDASLQLQSEMVKVRDDLKNLLDAIAVKFPVHNRPPAEN